MEYIKEECGLIALYRTNPAARESSHYLEQVQLVSPRPRHDRSDSAGAEKIEAKREVQRHGGPTPAARRRRRSWVGVLAGKVRVEAFLRREGRYTWLTSWGAGRLEDL